MCIHCKGRWLGQRSWNLGFWVREIGGFLFATNCNYSDQGLDEMLFSYEPINQSYQTVPLSSHH